MRWLIVRFAVVTAAALGSAGCFVIDAIERVDTAAMARIDNFKRELELNVDGQPIVLPLGEFDVYLPTDDTTPEVFEIWGEEVNLVGSLPPGDMVGIEDNWKGLVGKPIEISATVNSDEVEQQDSTPTLPGRGEVKVLGGHIMIDHVEATYESQTPLRGTIELRIQTPTGEQTLPGKISAVGITWS
jgi:hypothetical protein